MGPGRAGMGSECCKTKHMANLDWMGPEPGCPGSDPGEGLDGTPRDSNRLLGLSGMAVVIYYRRSDLQCVVFLVWRGPLDHEKVCFCLLCAFSTAPSWNPF